MTQCCKTCRFLDVPLDKAGRRVVRKDSVYRCKGPVPAAPNLPDSVTQAYGFMRTAWVHRQYMPGDMGTTCPVWEALK